jgi:hypothetical protein
MNSIEKRIKQLEKYRPTPLTASMTDEELQAAMFEICRQMHELGFDESEFAEAVLINPDCRQFVRNSTMWTHNRTHRISVFLEFRKCVCGLPCQERAFDIFGYGWGDNRIETSDINWLVEAMKDIDLGQEKNWLRDYLECSGS